MRQELSEKLNFGSPTKMSSLPMDIHETQSDPLTDRVAKDSCTNLLEIGSVEVEAESSEASLYKEDSMIIRESVKGELEVVSSASDISIHSFEQEELSSQEEEKD